MISTFLLVESKLFLRFIQASWRLLLSRWLLNNLKHIMKEELIKVKLFLFEGFFDCCKHSCELHFPSIAHQIKNLSQTAWNEGDFFITRHSNLHNIHIVFHLFARMEDYWFSDRQEFHSRSASLAGLRKIFQIISAYHIDTCTLPISLIKHPSVATKNVLIKNSEILFRSVKGFFMENSKSTKNLNAVKTTSFWIPWNVDAEMFDILRNTLCHFFKAQ